MNTYLRPLFFKFYFLLKFIFLMSFVPPVFAAVTITTIGTGGKPSLVLNSQDHPVINYYDYDFKNSKFVLKLAVCGNPTCTSGNILIPVDNVPVLITGSSSSLILNNQDHPVMSYTDLLGLKLAVCDNPTCTSKTFSIIEETVEYSFDLSPSIVLNSQGHPIVSYRKWYFPLSLSIASCGNPTCTFGNLLTIVDNSIKSWHSSLVMNDQGYPVIAYDDDSSAKLRLVVCGNASCSSGNILSTVNGTSGSSPSLVLNKQGYPVISYYDKTDQSIKIVVCGNSTCTFNNILTAIDSGESNINDGWSTSSLTSLVLNHQDHPIISYGSDGDGGINIKLAICGNPTCTSGNVLTTIESTDWSPSQRTTSSLALNSQGYPIISYDDRSNGTIKLAVCDTPTCSDLPEIDLQGNDLSIPTGDTTPSSLDGTDFGSLGIGTSLIHSFILQNQGGNNLEITHINLSETGCDSFTLTPPSLLTLVPNEITTFQLTFTPTTLGIFTCQINIESNDPDENPYTFFIQGQGQTEQDIDLQCHDLPIPNGSTTPNLRDGTDFGNVTLGSTPLHTFTIQNLGGNLLDLTDISLLGDSCYPFSISGFSPSQLASQETTSFQIAFAPPSPNAFTCQVRITSNDPDETPYTFEIQGDANEPTPTLPNTLTLFVAAEGPGQVTDHTETIQCPPGPCQANYPTATQVTLTATPDPQAYFSSWGGHPDCADGQVWMIESKRCVAYFHPLPTLTLTKEGEGQVIGEGLDCGTECTQFYPHHTSVILTATPAPLYQFKAWSGDCTGTSPTLTLTIEDRSLQCTAHFTPPATLTLTKEGEGQITGIGLDCGTNCTATYARGTELTLTATPTPPYYFDHWSGACSGTSTMLSFALNADQTCTALFSKDLAGSLACDHAPTLSSFQNGAWEDPLTWEDTTGQHRLPTTTDVVLIKHEVIADPFVKINTLCQHGTLRSPPQASLEIEVPGGLTNYGTIQGDSGCEAGQDITVKAAEGIQHNDKLGDFWYYTYATPGPISNYGKILGGSGSDCEGGQGGHVTLLGRGIINKGSIEGGRGGSSLHGSGGNGGRTQVFGRFGGSEWGNEGYVKSSGSIQGGAGGAGRIGGKGGNLWIVGYPQVFLGPNMDYTDFCWQCSTVNRTGHHAGQGGLGTEKSGDKGWVQIEPNVISIQAGESTEVIGGNVTIFGGDDWTLNLSHASKLLVEATENLTLAVGKQGIIDLTGNTTPVLKATGEVRLLADEVRLDPGISLAQVIQASQVTTGPATVLPSVTLAGSSQLIASPGMPKIIKFTLINGGPQADTYQVKVQNPTTGEMEEAVVEVPALDSRELTTEVTLSSEQKQALILTATSSSHPEVTATMQVTVQEKDEKIQSIKENGFQAMGKMTWEGVPMEGVSVKMGEKTAVSDASGYWVIEGLAEGQYVAEASQAGYRFTPQQVVVNENQPLAVVTFQEFEENPQTLVVKDKIGEKLLEVEKPVMNGKTAKKEDGPSEKVQKHEEDRLSEFLPSFPPVGIPLCPSTGWIDEICSNRGRVLTEASLSTRAMVSGGTLVGMIENKGFISQVMVQAGAVVSGGSLSGEIMNQGTLKDLRFVGSVIRGGMLAGKIMNESQVGGRLVNVTFAPQAHLVGGQLQGEIQGDRMYPVFLERVRVLTGTHLVGVKVGQGVILEKGVTVE